MEETLEPSAGHPLQGPHWDMSPELPAGFVPLRLIMEPLGLRIEVSKPDVVVGRHSQADVRLALLDISRRHCRLFFTEGQWRISDLASLNGVFVNGQRIQETTLYSGDHLQLGKFTFLVEHAAPVPAPPADNPKAAVLKSIVEVMKEAA